MTTATWFIQTSQLRLGKSKKMFKISQAQLDQLKTLIATIESSGIQADTANVSSYSLVNENPRKDELVNGFALDKQWQVCDVEVVYTFKQIVCDYFFDGSEEITNKFFKCFEGKDDYNRNVVISGGTVLAAYVAHKNKTFPSKKEIGDLDIFYVNQIFSVRDIETHIRVAGYTNKDDENVTYNYTQNGDETSNNKKKPRLDQYERMKRVKQVQNFTKNDSKIQLIQTEYDAVRSHIREFDLSCCQMFYMSGKIYMRQIYADLTEQNCMVLCWDKNLQTDTLYVERIRKYMARGWTPVTHFAHHIDQAPADFKQKMILKVYIRELFAPLTEQKYMLLDKHRILATNKAYVEHVRTCMARGWIPVTQSSFQMNQAPNDIKEKLIYLPTKQDVPVINVINVNDLIAQVQKAIETAKCYPSLEQFKRVIEVFVGALTHFQNDTQIANVHKAQLSSILQSILDFFGEAQSYLDRQETDLVLSTIANSLFKVKDRRWIIMKLVEHASLFQRIVTDNFMNKVEVQKFTKEQFYLLKSIVTN